MDRNTIIDGLRMTMELCVFDPSTGEEIEPHLLNDINRATYDACKGALEILEQLPPAQPERTPMQELLDVTADRDYWKAQCHSYEMTINRLTESALPENRTDKRTETHACDCISRQQAIDALREYLINKRVPEDGTLTARLIENEVINKLPSAQPEIIRCKDCKHNPKYEWFGCPMSLFSEKQRPETAWCWKAERRTDG